MDLLGWEIDSLLLPCFLFIIRSRSIAGLITSVPWCSTDGCAWRAGRSIPSDCCAEVRIELEGFQVLGVDPHVQLAMKSAPSLSITRRHLEFHTITELPNL